VSRRRRGARACSCGKEQEESSPHYAHAPTRHDD
jgi:hypothetical protein